MKVKVKQNMVVVTSSENIIHVMSMADARQLNTLLNSVLHEKKQKHYVNYNLLIEDGIPMDALTQ